MNDRITIDPRICHGHPVVRGTRVTVSQLLGSLASGDSAEDILEDYPSISPADLKAVLSFASGLANFEEAPYSVAFA